MKESLLAILFLSITLPVLGQTLSGKVVDESGHPIPYATIFDRTSQKGTASNEEGDFELALPQGRHEIRFQHLGYHTKHIDFGPEDQLNMTVVLVEEPISLQEVVVGDNMEDPAYTIMRRAIAKAEYHTLQLDGYSAQSYIKGSGRIKDVPRLFRKRILKAMEEEGMDTTTAFVVESVSEISYTRPDQYSEKVISVRSIGEDNNTSPQSFINGSFYEPELAGAISPLSPRAFAYYKFEYLGFFSEFGKDINKIRVIPKSRGDQLFEGILYIVDQDWSIHSLDLATYIWGIKFQCQQVYHPIEDVAWLPINHTYTVTGRFFGFDFEYQYFAQISDYDIQLNPELPDRLYLFDETIEKEKKKASAETFRKTSNDEAMEKLARGEEVSRKELRQIMREYEKQNQLEDQHDTLEHVQQIDNFEIDSNAHKRDDRYWQEVRPIPLTTYEVRGYERMDSIETVQNEATRDSSARDTVSTGGKKKRSFGLGRILFGHSARVSEHAKIGWESPLTTLHYNTVEGYHFGLPLFMRNNTKNLSLKSLLHYSIARKRFNPDVQLHLGNRTKGEWTFAGGRTTQQYNSTPAIDPYLNDFYTLFLERNYAKILEKRRFSAGYNRHFSDRLDADFTISQAQNRSLPNRSFEHWFNSEKYDLTSNFPLNSQIGDTYFEDYDIATISANVHWRPWLQYKIRNGEKEPLDRPTPEISLSAKVALPVSDYVDYQQLEVRWKQDIPNGIRGTLALNVQAGTFFNKKNIPFPEFKHFKGNQTFLTPFDNNSSYRLLPYYAFSTSENYLSVFTNYQFRKFLFSQIPEVRLTGIKESIFVNWLETPTSEHYFEVGYSLNYIFRVLRIEFVTSFRDWGYQDFGIRVGVADFDQLF